MKRSLSTAIFMFTGVFLLAGSYGNYTGNFSSCNPAKKFDADSLFNVHWVLRTINGVEIVKEKTGNGIPYLEFHQINSKLSGYTGCNDLSGKAAVTGDEIVFKDMSMTKMFCHDAKYEQDIVEVVFYKEVLKYKIVNGTLSIFKDGEEIMTLSKPD